MKPAILFVYGTLKRGGKNVGLMRGQQYLCDALTAPKYRIYDLGDRTILIKAHGQVLQLLLRCFRNDPV